MFLSYANYLFFSLVVIKHIFREGKHKETLAFASL